MYLVANAYYIGGNKMYEVILIEGNVLQVTKKDLASVIRVKKVLGYKKLY